ncbi:uncharacterized protein FTJAE_10988 [Fusarium tjaetaba]|uniref:Uncharacterized protein n=1 Tax=Fusarium tjaetaba TaxID=1567544 RepID=A0A8H5QW22_9HYPO|nr:uncharacterized protein FTJAE_10988 [Fusarium tjaetaba]KAF5622254.1 hypothetical protein FTJAE_10988 [Fusarium tjaetaba]
MCLTTFWKHECYICHHAIKENASLQDPAITGTCSAGCGEPVQVKLQWRLWICPRCEEETATDQPKYPPTGQQQERVAAYMFLDGTEPQNQYRRQDRPQRRNEPRFQDAAQLQGAPRVQDAPRSQDAPGNAPFQSNAGGYRAAPQYPPQLPEQRPQHFQTGYPPRVQNEPRRQGRRESHSHSHSHGHHHHHHY